MGAVVLQRAKVQYWRFYDKLKNDFRDKVSLLYGDTDSLMLKFAVEKGTSMKEMIAKSRTLTEYLDLSNMSGELHSDRYKGHFNKLKSETGSKIITEGIFLKPKLYSLLVQQGERKIAMKGISTKNSVPIRHEKFQNILDNVDLKIYANQARIQKIGENMCTIRQRKLALSVLDLKRYWLDLYTRLAYGHPNIKKVPGGGSHQDNVIPLRYKLHIPRP